MYSIHVCMYNNESPSKTSSGLSGSAVCPSCAKKQNKNKTKQTITSMRNQKLKPSPLFFFPEETKEKGEGGEGPVTILLIE